MNGRSRRMLRERIDRKMRERLRQEDQRRTAAHTAPAGFKWCPRGEHFQPRHEFGTRNRGKYLKSWCRECNRADQNQRNERKREQAVSTEAAAVELGTERVDPEARRAA